jgi:hypothetical protein
VWTDDMTVPLPADRSVADLVELTLTLSDQGVSGPELEAAVGRELMLSAEDAAVAVDRVLGGVTRASSRNQANAPDPTTDPIAFESWRRAMERTEP